MIYFTSDNHFGHANILRLCGRPFADVQEMDAFMESAWNSTVRPQDEVYVLGDLMFRTAADPASLLSRLNGKKHLIVGNHDPSWMKKTDVDRFFVSVSALETLRIDRVPIVLCHYPMLEWDGYYAGAYHVFGHIHNKTDQLYFPLIAANDRMLNAGVDVNGFRPVLFPELVKNNASFKARYRSENGMCK